MRPPIQSKIYDKEYFSDTQAALYIGDVFVDEVTSYGYFRQHQKTPIYGYASNKFDGVSDGPIIINGTFSINFKEAHYLYLVLMRYHNFAREINKRMDGITASQRNDQKLPSPILRVKNPKLPGQFVEKQTKIMRLGIERLMQGTATKDQRTEFYQALGGFASTYGLDKNFEDIAEVLEDQVWGVDATTFDDVVRQPDDSFFNNFDMYFTYGDYNNPAANHTVERITGVHLTGRSKSVNVSGQPIQEEYTFFGRDSY